MQITKYFLHVSMFLLNLSFTLPISFSSRLCLSLRNAVDRQININAAPYEKGKISVIGEVHNNENLLSKLLFEESSGRKITSYNNPNVQTTHSNTTKSGFGAQASIRNVGEEPFACLAKVRWRGMLVDECYVACFICVRYRAAIYYRCTTMT